MTEFKGDFDTCVRSAWVPITYGHVPIETDVLVFEVSWVNLQKTE